MICLLIEKLRAGFEMPRDRTKKHLINAYNDLYFAFSLHITSSIKKVTQVNSLHHPQSLHCQYLVIITVFNNNNNNNN